MQPPPGYDSVGENMVLQLHKLLYGLKQARRQWYDTLVRTLTDLGFHVSQADPGVLQTCVQGDALIVTLLRALRPDIGGLGDFESQVLDWCAF